MPSANHARAGQLTRLPAACVATLAITLLALLPWLTSPARAATFTVTNLNDSGPGSLRQAILDANASAANDTIVFAPATNGGTLTLASALPALAANGTLAINGNGATNTTVSGNNAVGVFAIDAGANVIIRGLTIRDGEAGTNDGGGISNRGTLIVGEVSFKSNNASTGGAIYNATGSSLTVINTAFDSNTAATGGAMFGFGMTLNLVNSTLSANSAATGGGIFVNQVTLSISNTIIANSPAGGDCFAFASTIIIQNSLIENAACGITNGTNGNRTGDPALNADLTLSAASSARDAGLDALIPVGVTLDLAGNLRSFGPSVDMGAYEFGSGPPSGATPTSTATPTTSPTPTRTPGLAPNRLALPMLGNRLPVFQPDLVVEAITLSPDQREFAAGEPVQIAVRVTNVGDGPASAFWVDLYINPSAPPDAVNQRWNERCGLVPCYGMAWLVGGLAPGASVTLTSSDFDPGQSIWPGAFAPGTSVLYAYADTWYPGLATGAVPERDETNNLARLGGLSVSGGSLTTTSSIDPARLPMRARP